MKSNVVHLRPAKPVEHGRRHQRHVPRRATVNKSEDVLSAFFGLVALVIILGGVIMYFMK